jgi:hypothetical protein
MISTISPFLLNGEQTERLLLSIQKYRRWALASLPHTRAQYLQKKVAPSVTQERTLRVLLTGFASATVYACDFK